MAKIFFATDPYFLGSDFALLPDRGDGRSGRDRYVYDPVDPTPSPLMFDDDEMESRYGELLSERKDIVGYRSAPVHTENPIRLLDACTYKISP